MAKCLQTRNKLEKMRQTNQAKKNEREKMQQDIRLFINKNVKWGEGRVEYTKCGTAEPIANIDRVELDEHSEYEGGTAEPNNFDKCGRTEPARRVPERGNIETECGRTEPANKRTECGKNERQAKPTECWRAETKGTECGVGQAEHTECGQDDGGHSECQAEPTDCGRAEPIGTGCGTYDGGHSVPS